MRRAVVSVSVGVGSSLYLGISGWFGLVYRRSVAVLSRHAIVSRRLVDVYGRDGPEPASAGVRRAHDPGDRVRPRVLFVDTAAGCVAYRVQHGQHPVGQRLEVLVSWRDVERR